MNAYLMLLADKNFNTVIEIYNPAIWSNSSYVHLFENLGVDTDEITENTEVVVIKEGVQNVDVIECQSYVFASVFNEQTLNTDDLLFIQKGICGNKTQVFLPSAAVADIDNFSRSLLKQP